MRRLAFFVLIALIGLCLLAGTRVGGVAAGSAALQQLPPAPPPPPPPPMHPKAPPKILHKVQPVYPPEAKTQGVQGAVVLHVVVDASGQPEAVRVMSGNPMLTSAAVDAVRQWRWEPVVVDGKPATVGTKVTVNFKLADAKRKK